MSTKIFNSNETLEMCDVTVTQEGSVTIKTKSYHTAELERLGKPEKTIRGRMKMVEQNIVFDPYAEGSRKPTYKKQVVVGSTTLAVTEDKVKISFMVPRHLSKPLMTLYIQSEIDEVKRRLDTDVYDSLVRGQQTTDNRQPTTNREQSSSLELPRCEGGKACAAGLTETTNREQSSSLELPRCEGGKACAAGLTEISTGGSPLTVDRCPLSTEEKGGAA